MGAETYAGGCQCGAVRYSVEVDLDHTLSCNCSRCRRLGLILAFAPKDAFTLEAGADATTEYRFNKHVIRHLFCTTCGVQPYAEGAMPDGTPVVAVNIRCLDGVDLGALRPRPVDGASA